MGGVYIDTDHFEGLIAWLQASLELELSVWPSVCQIDNIR